MAGIVFILKNRRQTKHKKKLIPINELQSVKEKLQEIQDIIREFDIKFADLAKKADGNNYVIFLVEGNALKGEAEKMGAHMEIWKGDLN